MIPAVLLNESLKRFIPIARDDIKGQERLSRALAKPYLTYDSVGEEKPISHEMRSSLGLVGDDKVIRTPFPIFRFCIESTKGVQMCGLAERKESELHVVAFNRKKGVGRFSTFCSIIFKSPREGLSEDLNYTLRIYDADTLGEITEEIKYSQDFSGQKNRTIEISGHQEAEVAKSTVAKLRKDVKLRERRICQLKEIVLFLEEGVLPVIPGASHFSQQEYARDGFMAFYDVISSICYQYLSSGNFVAKVTPNTLSKSVEWRQAREHYTLIHRHHPANDPMLKNNATIPTDEKHIHRIAHSRRAHTRLLKSDKFRYKKGLRIAVRSSWCGPKEWQDTAGQTYQILEPVI